MNQKTRRSRGVVLITVVLLLLVLTVLGLAAAVIMTQEDQSSGRSELSKEALYVAETGLRRGEGVLRGIEFSANILTTMLQYNTATACPAVEPRVPVRPVIGSWDLQHLGTYMREGVVELSNVNVTSAFGLQGRRAFYSVYVRNNEDDGSNPGTINNDARIRIVAVGWVANAAGQPLAVKILEEEFGFTGINQSPSTQKQSDTGGTGSGVYD
jgi:Tfp pilus assembly protein PilX